MHASLNPYLFANDDPVNGSDPMGLDASGLEEVCGQLGGQYAEFDSRSICIMGGGTGQLPTVTTTAQGTGSSAGTSGGYGSSLGGPGGAAGTAGGAGEGATTDRPTAPKWRSLKCAAAVAEVAIAGVSTAAFGLEAAAVVAAGEGTAAVLGGVAEAFVTEATGLKAAPLPFNTNATIAHALGNSLVFRGRDALEGIFVSRAFHESYSLGDFALDLLPGVNLVHALGRAGGACL